jgi:signal transduction histidine kinase
MSLKPLRNFRKSAGLRLTFWYSGIFFISSLVLFALTYFLLVFYLRENDQAVIQAKLQALSILYEAGGMEDLRKDVAIEKDPKKKDLFLVRVSGEKNETLFLNVPSRSAEFDFRELETIALEGGGQWVLLRAKKGRTVFEIATSELLDGNMLQVGKSSKDREKILFQFRKIFSIVIFPLLGLGLGGGIFLAVRTFRPIRHLIETVQSVFTGKLQTRVQIPHTGDEFDELARLFNGMLEKIEVLIRGMRDSLDNVAHDLRTPMARLRAGAETALQSAQDMDVYRETLADCIEESDQILKMLNTLMDISEAETGIMKLDLKVFDLTTLIEQTVDVYDYLAGEKALTIQRRIPSNLFLRADPNRVRQVIGNLLDNAIKYTPAGGKVELDAHVDGKDTVITVTDTGIGISPEDLPRIWDRLFRGDKSRSARGLGLGLSLVKAVVEAHGGRVEARSEPISGSVFTIYIPNYIVQGRTMSGALQHETRETSLRQVDKENLRKAST